MDRLKVLFSKRVTWVVLSVLALTGVIFIGGALSADRAPVSAPKTGLTQTESAADLVDRASEALTQNETSTALALAEKALAVEPGNAAALQIVKQATPAQATDPAPAGTTPDDPAQEPASDEGYIEAVKQLGTLLPAKIQGWTPGRLLVTSPDALVTFEPELSNPADAQVVRAVFSVHDLEKTSAAKSFITKVTKIVYSKDAAELKVGVVRPYFGTDGRKVASAAFSRGRFAFEVQVIGEAGVNPKTLKQTAETLIAAFEAAVKE